MRFSIASLALIATMALQIAVLFVFLNEPTQPPIRGAFSEALWVKARPELVYAFLALLVFGPALLMIFATMARRYLVRVMYVGLWLAFAIMLTVQASQKFTTVASVTWDYVLKDRIPEARADDKSPAH
jgi:hypothetical protein